MEESDIKIYLKAKKGVTIAKIDSAFFLLFALGFPFYDALGIIEKAAIILPSIAMFLFVNVWIGFNGVSQTDLVALIERQMAKDPEAIKRLSKHGT